MLIHAKHTALYAQYGRHIDPGGFAVESGAAIYHMVNGNDNMRRKWTGALGPIHASRRKPRGQHGHTKSGRGRYVHGLLFVRDRCARLSISRQLPEQLVCMDRIVAMHWRGHAGHALVGGVADDIDIHIGGAVSVDCRSIWGASTIDNAQCAALFVFNLVDGIGDCHLAR